MKVRAQVQITITRQVEFITLTIDEDSMIAAAIANFKLEYGDEFAGDCDEITVPYWEIEP